MIQEIFRVREAGLHFNLKDARSRVVRQYLRLLTTLVGRAEKEACELIKEGLSLERNEAGELTRVELVIRAASSQDVIGAQQILARKEEASNGSDEKTDGSGSLSPLQKAMPKYNNSYHLVKVFQADGQTWFHFILFESYLYQVDRGPRSGQTIRSKATIDSLCFQRLVTRFVRPPLFEQIPSANKGGCAQEVVQQILSHLGLIESDCQSSVGSPALEGCDPKTVVRRNREARDDLSLVEELAMTTARKLRRGRFAASDPAGDELVPSDPRWQKGLYPVRVKRQPQRLVNRIDISIHLRRWNEHGRARVGLYLALPLPTTRALKPDSPLWRFITQAENERFNFFWWHPRCDEFRPLPPWQDKSLTDRKRALVIPITVPGISSFRRLQKCSGDLSSPQHSPFIRSLCDPNWQVCWSLIVERAGEFCLQVVLKRQVETESKPNLLAVHPAVVETVDGWRTILFWSLLTGVKLASADQIEVDFLPRDGRWPDQKNRRRLSYAASRLIVRMAHELNADLAVDEVGGVKKRGPDSMNNAIATRFTYSLLSRLIEDKALELEPPVRVITVSSFHLKDDRDRSHLEQTVLLGQAGLKIKQRLDQRMT